VARGALAAGVGETRPAPRFRAAKAARSQLEAGNYALSGLGVVGGGVVPGALPRAVAGRPVGAREGGRRTHFVLSRSGVCHHTGGA